MSEVQDVVLGHFTTFRVSHPFWALSADERRDAASRWITGLRDRAEALEIYLTQGVESASDVLVWSSVRVPEADAPGRFFRERARAEAPFRRYFEPVHVLWGLTRPSEYSKARSTQEIDPFDGNRSPYLVAYPFTKTAAWYLLGRETRQGMMNEHIRIGKQFREITQLLLYSFGLQDQEFVVVYETDDLGLFSRLVYDLRDTEARRYTAYDTPLHTGIRVELDEWLETLG